MVKNLSANTGDIRDMGSIPALGRSPEGGRGKPLQYSAWRIPWTEESYGLQSMDCKESDTTEATWHAHTCMLTSRPIAGVVTRGMA